MLPDSTPPVITAQPLDTLVFTGATAIFRVRATGAVPMAYAWYRDSLLIAGADSSVYRFPNAARADSGARFRFGSPMRSDPL